MTEISRGPRAYLILALIAGLAALAGVFTLPPLDRDESRFAQATAQMLETGNFVEINFLDEERNKKPVGIHWLQAASVAALSSAEAREIWAYRIPSMFGAMLAALACFWGGQRLVGREAAFAGAALFAATVMLGIEGGIAKTDAVLAGATTLALAALANLRAGPVGASGRLTEFRHDRGYFQRFTIDLDSFKHASGDVVGVGHHVLNAIDGANRHPRAFELADDVSRAVLTAPRG